MLNKLVFAIAPLTLVSVAAGQDADRVSFRFAPPVGTSFVRTTTIASWVQSDDDAEPDAEKYIFRNRFTWRESPRGKALVMSPLRVSGQEEDARPQPGLAALLAEADLVFHYDNEGNWLGMNGLESAVEILLSRTPEEAHGLFEPLIPNWKQTLEKQWSGRFSLVNVLAGRTIAPGQRWGGDFEYPLLPGAVVSGKMEGRAVGWEEFGGVKRLRIDQDLLIEDERLGIALGAAVGGMIRGVVDFLPVSDEERSAAVAELEGRLSEFRITGMLERDSRALDPQTMLTYDRLIMQVIQFEGQGAEGEAEVLRFVKTQRHAYEYLE